MKEWFSPKELTEIAGMPSTTQGINRKARAEKWEVRKRTGIRGKALEYHIQSLPLDVKKELKVKDDMGAYVIPSIEPVQVWMNAFEQLSKDEQRLATSWLTRNGINNFIAFIKKAEKDS